MGGNLAIDLAAELPDQVTGLILVESVPCMRELMMPGVPASSLNYNSPYNDKILAMSDDDFKKMATGMAQNMTSVPAKIDVLTNWSIKADRKTYVFGYTDLLNSFGEVDRLIRMMLLDELDYGEIATVIGISEGNLRVKIHRIKIDLFSISKTNQWFRYNRHPRVLHDWFFMLTPEFSLHFSTPVLIMIKLSYTPAAILFT